MSTHLEVSTAGQLLVKESKHSKLSPQVRAITARVGIVGRADGLSTAGDEIVW